MRTLLLLRGAPGCGKSTFIDQNFLRPYALSADEIRLQCQSAQLSVNGEVEISQNNDTEVWKMFFKLLEIRMENGEFTVIDATNSKTSDMTRYKEMADHYRYRIYCIDFTDLPIEECKRRNAQRTPLKRVPEYVIDKMYSRFANQKVPAGIKVLKPNELNTIFMKKFDFNEYEKIVHIGDIHGCYSALMKYFKNGLNDKYFYIFVGDYIDRGIENAETLKFLISIKDKKNVLFLEGNHERWLWIYANGGYGKSKEFEFVTKPQLEAAGIDLKDIRQFYRRLGQCAWYTYNGKDVLVTHGGLSTMPTDLTKIATSQMIKGVGKYEDYETIADAWMNTTNKNCYQIHGHRNTKTDKMRIRDRVFNLEGKVEFGGHLRILELDKNGFHNGFTEILIKNEVFKAPEVVSADKEITKSSTADILIKLRNNPFIQEKKFGNISSFNFSKEAFYDKVWNEQTILARGLYINTNSMKIVARGFNKFFNVNERPETKFEMLQYSLQFPVTCYVKENGFLGLVSYNEETDDLFITTKSNPNGDFAIWLKDIIYRKMSKEDINKMKEICKNNNVTFVFECVDMTNDPHIIEYFEDKLYLLAIISNTVQFSQYKYDELLNIGYELNLEVKTKAYEIANWSEFYDWYTEVTQPDYEFEGRNIEGFVVEDARGYMTKVKLDFYNTWKHMRAVAHETLRTGFFRRTGSLTTPIANKFYAFCQKLYNETTPEQRELIPKNIIYLRKLFLKEV